MGLVGRILACSVPSLECLGFECLVFRHVVAVPLKPRFVLIQKHLLQSAGTLIQTDLKRVHFIRRMRNNNVSLQVQ